jgi:hypothetical protein
MTVLGVVVAAIVVVTMRQQPVGAPADVPISPPSITTATLPPVPLPATVPPKVTLPSKAPG